MGKTWTFWVLLAVLIVGTILPACGGPPAPAPTLTPEDSLVPVAAATPEGRGAGDTLRILYWQAPTILNPHLTTGAKDWAASRLTYEPLASYDQDGNLIPFLAAEIPSLENGGVAPDGRSVTWKLKQGVQWSDGEPFTADDVLFTFEFVTNPDTGATTASTYAGIDRVEVLDAHTVKLQFRDVTPAWSLPFVGMLGMILPRHAFAGYDGTNAREAPANKMPVGTGPYRVIKFKTEEVLFLGSQLIETNKIVYEPNPFFREPDKPYFRRVEFRGGGTVGEAARSVLQVGDVDYADNLQLDSETLAELEAGGAGRVVANFGFFVERIVLNRSDPNRTTAGGERSSVQIPHPFFSDLRVRQAFNYAIDRHAIAALYGPTGRLTTNMLVSPSMYDSPNTRYVFNPSRAKALLNEADWRDTDGDGIRDKNGQKLSVVFQTAVNPLRQETQKLVKANLEAIGVEVELTIIDSSIFFSNDPTNPNTRVRFQADMEEYQTGNRSPDPGAYMKWWTCPEIAQQANNWSGNNVERWCSPEYDALYEESTREMDPVKRAELFIRMNDMIINDVVQIPLVHRADVAGISNSLEGFEFTPWDTPFWNIKDWRRTSP